MYVKKVKNLPVAQTRDIIGTVIDQTKTTHDPVLVYEGDKFSGVIWPYQILYEAKPVLRTKVKSLMVTPPEITADSDIYDVVEQMVAMRLFTLPVFGVVERVLGVISARDILADMQVGSDWEEVWQLVKPQPPVMAGMHTKLREILPQLRKKKKSRIVVTDSGGKLVGVVGRREVYLALSRPAVEKQRYSSRKGLIKQGDYDEDWQMKLDYPVANIMRAEVVWSDADQPQVWLKKLVDGGTNSVVIVDKNSRPTGVVGILDFLKGIVISRPQGGAMIRLDDKHNLLDPVRRQAMEKMMRRLGHKLERLTEISSVKVVVDAMGSFRSKPRAYRVAAEATNGVGTVKRASAENKEAKAAVREAFDELEEQIRRDKGRTKFG